MTSQSGVEEALQKLIALQLPFSAAFRPNATMKQTDEMLQNFPLQLPTEANIYFNWLVPLGKDNALPELRSGWLFYGGHLLPLQQAIQSYWQNVQFRQESIRPTATSATVQNPYLITSFYNIEKVQWLLIFGTGGSAEFRIICSDIVQATAPIYYHAHDGGLTYLAFDSLTALLHTTADAFAAGAYVVQSGNYFIREDRRKVASILNHYNPRRREYFLHFAQATSLEQLIQKLDHPDTQMHRYAYRALRHLYEPEVVPLLIQQLQHPKAKVREDAVNLLGYLEDEQALEPLLPLLGDPDPAVQLATVNALVISFRNPKIADPLLAQLPQKDEKLQERILFGLGELREQRAVPMLLESLSTSSRSTRIASAEALGKIADPETVPALIQALQDKDVIVQSRAIGALGDMGDARALDSLAIIAATSPPPPLDFMPRIAREAIAKIRCRDG